MWIKNSIENTVVSAPMFCLDLDRQSSKNLAILNGLQERSDNDRDRQVRFQMIFVCTVNEDIISSHQPAFLLINVL